MSYRQAFLTTALVCLLAAPASWGQTYSPTASDPTTQNTAVGTRALPTCQTQLATCRNTLTSTLGNLARCRNTLTSTLGNLARCTTDLGDCQTDLDACEAAPPVVLPGDGQGGTAMDFGLYHGPALTYTDHGNGTFTDNNTLLMWEKKDTAPDSIHWIENLYRWSSSGTAADGIVFTLFLARLNTTPCFAGHCDWRIPNIRELQSLVDYSAIDPPLHATFPGPTRGSGYWSTTSLADDLSHVWSVDFVSGRVIASFSKSDFWPARAVRGGQ